jgi:hypothetical protein
MRRRLTTAGLALAVLLATPAAALAHDQPESSRSRWIMADWMMEVFFLFGGIALLAFVMAWKAGHFHDLAQAARIPLLIDEPDYYTPDWALDEEEWDDVHAER